MADVKWIKITTDIFDDEKILLIESLPDAYAIITVWFKLLCLAGKQNNSGVFMMGRVAYTDKMLATIFRMKETTVTMALQTFEQFGMVEIIDGVITIPNWEKHQSLDTLEQAREQTRKRVAKHREKQKLLAANGSMICQYCGDTATGFDHIVPIARGGKDVDSNKVPCCISCNRIKNDKPLVDFLNNNREIVNDEIVTSNRLLSRFVTLCNVTQRYVVTQCNADRIEEDKEEDKKKIDYIQIRDLYNDTCVSFPRLTVLSDKRKQAIKARLNTYTIDQFKEMFEKAEASPFLKGANNRNWQANFDWLIKDSNFAKVLDGNYDGNPQKTTQQQKPQTGYDDFMSQLAAMRTGE